MVEKKEEEKKEEVAQLNDEDGDEEEEAEFDNFQPVGTSKFHRNLSLSLFFFAILCTMCI